MVTTTTTATEAAAPELNRPFAHTPCDPAGHFTLHFYTAIFWLLNYLQTLAAERGQALDESLQAHPFLAGYFAEMRGQMPEQLTWEAGAIWWQRQISAWEATVPVHLPLSTLGNAAGADFDRRIGFVLAGLVEEDSRFGALFAHLQAPLPYRRPTLELLTQIWRLNTASMGLGTPLYKGLLADGLLVADQQDAPRAEWLIRVPHRLWDAAQGEVHPGADLGNLLDYYPPTHFAPLEALILPPALCDQLRHLPALIRQQQVDVIILRSTPGSTRLPVMGALARLLDRGLVVINGQRLSPGAGQEIGPLCLLTNALPVLTYDLAPGETALLPALTAYAGPLGLLLGPEGGVSGPSMQRAVTLTLPKPTLAERRRLWQCALGNLATETLEEISRQFHLPDGYIRQAADVAATNAALTGRTQVTLPDVRAACRTLNRQKLETLATYLEAGGAWAQLVIGEQPAAKLRELESRCRHREELLAQLSPAFADSANRGVRALFNGPSGTGKTLAAKILSAELGIDLYRVDLAAVVNKYIGETEKNLHQILSHAEELDVILLLDEGDALLGNRTEVKSANDRYANLETNFLLQRLEHYQGIVLITTNVGENIDSAFQRRMDVVVTFTPPREQERWQIWQLHLPANHTVTDHYLESVALRCPLTGGQIRNAALHATLLALHEQGDAAGRKAQVSNRHLAEALRSEYRKAGASFPLHESSHQNGHRQGMAAFLETL